MQPGAFVPTPVESQPSAVSSREALEQDVCAAAHLVLAARSAVDAGRTALAPFEEGARRARARRRAALDSLRLTEAAARSCGLVASPVMRLATARHADAARTATQELRDVIAEAQSTCASLDEAYEGLRAARAYHITALRLLAARLEAENDSASATAERRLFAVSEAKRLEDAQAHDDRSWQAEREWANGGHYDPHYDAREIAQRRARPWV